MIGHQHVPERRTVRKALIVGTRCNDSWEGDSWSYGPERAAADHWESFIITTSVVCVPHASATLRPSGDQAKLKIRPDLKSVNGRGAPPSSDWLQMFDTPLRVST